MQEGSVSAASPVTAKAWQRQPPRSSSLRGQLAHGSFIQPKPRYFSSASDDSQIVASGVLAGIADAMSDPTGRREDE